MLAESIVCPLYVHSTLIKANSHFPNIQLFAHPNPELSTMNINNEIEKSIKVASVFDNGNPLAHVQYDTYKVPTMVAKIFHSRRKVK